MYELILDMFAWQPQTRGFHRIFLVRSAHSLRQCSFYLVGWTILKAYWRLKKNLSLEKINLYCLVDLKWNGELHDSSEKMVTSFEVLSSTTGGWVIGDWTCIFEIGHSQSGEGCREGDGSGSPRQSQCNNPRSLAYNKNHIPYVVL